MDFLRTALIIAAKDLRSEFRTKEALNASLSFAVVILLLFSFAFDNVSTSLAEFSGGLLWLVFSFSGALILNRGFAREIPNDCLEVLVASPASGAALFLGKTLASFTLLLGIEFLCMPIFGIFYDAQWTNQILPLAGVFSLATWGMAIIGTMFGALTVNLRLRELMLPMLIYPMLIPALMAAMKLTVVLLSGEPIGSEDMIWLRLLAGFDIIFTALSLALVETILVR